LRKTLILVLSGALLAAAVSAQPREEALFRGDETPL